MTIEVQGGTSISDYGQNQSTASGHYGNKARRKLWRGKKPSMGKDLDELANTVLKNPASLLTSKKRAQQRYERRSETGPKIK